MRYLLDTHTFIWLATDDRRVPPQVIEKLSQPDAQLALSAASVWEICIKVATGRMRLPKDTRSFIDDQIVAQRIDPLAISFLHALQVEQFPHHHRDPFDRMLAAQALVESVTLVTDDSALGAYPISILW